MLVACVLCSLSLVVPVVPTVAYNGVTEASGVFFSLLSENTIGSDSIALRGHRN
jgi:hypothetical protein